MSRLSYFLVRGSNRTRCLLLGVAMLTLYVLMNFSLVEFVVNDTRAYIIMNWTTLLDVSNFGLNLKANHTNQQQSLTAMAHDRSRPLIVTAMAHDRTRPHIVTAMPLDRTRPHIDCARLFHGDPTEQRKAELYQEYHSKTPISDEKYKIKARDCDKFITHMGYITAPSSDEEREFPLAFSILMFKDLEQFERLLRTIYRSHNFYCVHVDKKAETSLHEAVDAIVGCFGNVFVLRNNVEVYRDTFSVVEPEIRCMKELLKHKKWKYFINLTGQEFPLKTNWELVQILKALNGSSIVGGSTKNNFPHRRAGRPPLPLQGIIPSKGPVHITVRREFVEFVVNDDRAHLIMDWTKLLDVPDETFFTTLHHNPKLRIPGSYLWVPETNWKQYPSLNRCKLWKGSNRKCHGNYHHHICIFGIGDLPSLAESRSLFANKFHLYYQPLALDCMEELIRNRSLKQIHGRREFNTSYYSALEMARNHL